MYKIKEMPESERPRERMMAFGVESLSTTELIAILLQSGSKDFSAVEVAKAIIHDTNELADLKEKTISELMLIRGVGKAKAISLLSAIELGKRVYSERKETLKIQSPKDVYQLMKDDCLGLKQEVLFVLFLDLKTNLIAKKKIYVGSLNQSLIHPREVFKFAVKYSAFQIILVHNHPSGDPDPSKQDIDVTKKFKEMGNMMQIELIDHVVIGANRYISIFDLLRQNPTF